MTAFLINLSMFKDNEHLNLKLTLYFRHYVNFKFEI